METAMVGAVSASAMTAMSRGQERMAGAAKVLATDVDPTAMVDLSLGKAQVRVGVALARTADELVGTLIDELA